MHTEHLTITAAAARLGKSRPTLSRQLRRHGVAPDKRGLYAWPDILAAHKAGIDADKAALASGPAAKGLHGERLAQQIRKLTAEAATVEFRLAQLRGEHIPVAEHRARVQAVVAVLRQAHDTFLSTLAAECGDVATKHRLEGARKAAYTAIRASLDA